MTAVRVTVLYFAAAREAAGTSSETVELPDGADVAALSAALAARHPGLARILPRCRVAVDQEFAPSDLRIGDGAEIAVIPPVSGGAAAIRVQGTPPSLDEAVASVSGPDAGGVVTFTGAVRGTSRGHTVTRLEYEAYGPMAEAVLHKIAAECAGRAPGVRVSILHRVGVLAPGEVAVVIAAAAPHRAEAFDACRHAIERLKQDVPIWKKEVYEDGSEWVGLGP